MRYAALDVGLKRIGLALSPDGSIVLPQPAIVRKGRKQAARDVKRFLTEWGVQEVVVGIPLGGSSQEEMQRRIKHFVSLLELTIPIHYQDESFSSFEAKAILKGDIPQKRDGRIDSIAAQIILERFLANGA